MAIRFIHYSIYICGGINLNKRFRIWLIVLIFVLAGSVFLSVFTKIQNNRIQELRNTLDSLEHGQSKYLDNKYFNEGDSL